LHRIALRTRSEIQTQLPVLIFDEFEGIYFLKAAAARAAVFEKYTRVLKLQTVCRAFGCA
jgi:hypothetical protein